MKTTPNNMNCIQKAFLVFSIFLSTILHAQTYPVQVNPQLVPPYSVKISDYATTNSEKLFVNILLTDVNEIGRRIRLKMYIEGQGLSLITQDFVVGATPIFIDGGINLRLSNVDLKPYFQLNNLSGISPQQYNAPLPNGGYDFCFEVYDYASGLKLSNKGCTTAYLLQNDPPILNLPFKNNIVTAINPQNILFTWTPRQSNVSNVQYEYTLKEIWNEQNPQASFLATPSFYQTITQSTTLLVGPEAPQLLEGKIYGWQVRAFVSDGINETSVFKNDGKSEIFWFKYLSDCKAPSFVISQALNSQSVRVNWQTSDHLRYQIQYRKKGFGDDDWFEVNSYTNEGTIHSLEPGTIYEFRVGGECTKLSGYAYSNLQEFTTPTEDEAAYYNCGLMPQINITNTDPLPSLGVNETFTAGDFPVVTREVTGSNGSFSGWGYITLPFLENIKEIIDAVNIASNDGSDENGKGGNINIGKYTRIKVEFKDVQINTNNQLTQGVVETSYDANWSNILDVDGVIDDIVGDDGKIDGYDASNLDIKEVKVDESGSVVLVTEDGEEQTIVTDKPVVVTDKNGDQWTVDEEGKVTKGSAAEGGAPNSNNTAGVSNSGSVKEISSKDVQVKFIPSGYYSVDELNSNITSEKYKKEYEIIKTHDNKEYSVLYKLVSDKPKNPDTIKAEVTFANGKTTKDIIFKTAKGSKVTTSWSGNTATLELKRTYNFAKDEILATVKPKDSAKKYEVAGKLNTWHVQQRSINLTLVSVNGASIDGVKERINEIYNKAGVYFKTDSTSIDVNITTLDVGDSDMISHYTDGEKGIISEFKKKGTSKDQYYMFFIDKSNISLSKDLEGFMPLKRQFGFVFTSQDAGKVAAHELGHGIFGLKHPFDQYNDSNSEAKTDYLMDYGSGTILSHMDWQKLHAPGIQLYLFQGDEAGEYKNGYLISKILQEIRCKYKSEDYQIDDYLDNFIKRITFPYGNLKQSEDYKITLLNYDKGTPKSVNAKIVIGRRESVSTLKSSPIVFKEVKNKRVISKAFFDGYEYDLGGIVIWSDFDLEIKGDGSQFANYLANDYTYINVTKNNDVDAKSENTTNSSSENGIKTETLEEVVISAITLNSYIKKYIIQDEDISRKEFKILKSIASCDSKSLSLDTRFKIIKLISDKWIINEKKEDLVLDLLKMTPSKDYDLLLTKFQENPKVYSDFAAGIDDWAIFDGEENNKHRLYDELFTIWSKSKYYKDPYTYHPKNGGKYDSDNRDKEFYREIQIEIESFIYKNFNSECLNDFKNKGLSDLLTCLDVAPVSKIQRISYDDRKLMIEKILKEGSFHDSSFTGTYEKPIIRLLKYLPDNFNHDTFITYLVKTPITIYGSENRYGTKSTTTATIIKILFDKINDSNFLFSGDYRKELINAFIYLKARSQGIKQSIDDIKKGVKEYDIDALEGKLAFYSYDYRNILKRLFTSLPINGIGGFDYYMSLETELKDNDGTSPAVLNIQQTLKNGVIIKSVMSDKDHDPFELILFLNLSKQPLLSDFSKADKNGKKSAAMVPAIVAHYASVEGDNQTKADLIQTTVDVATLAIPGGQVRGIGKLFYYADKISSLASIAGTYNREENPKLASIFNKVSMATGLISMGDLAQSGYKALLKRKAENLNKLTPGEIADNLAKQSDETLEVLNKYPEELDNLIETGNTKTINDFANILEKENKALGKGISDVYARKVDKVVKRLRDFAKGKKIPAKYVTKAEELIKGLKPIEEVVTKKLPNIVQSVRGKMEGLDFRMKTIESLARKLLNDGIDTPMNDVLRYTASIDDAKFTDGVFSIVKQMQDKGYEIIKVKNTFEADAIYKGINANFKTPSGKIFELQFHTPKSFNVKQNINHTLYEAYRKLDPKSEEAIKLAQQMKNNSKGVAHPTNVSKISLYNFKTNLVDDFIDLLTQKQLFNKYDDLSGELQKLFRDDFINASDDVIESLKNNDSFEFWLNYRKKNPRTPSCK